MSAGPVVAMVWEGRDAVKTGRVMLGATKPLDSAPGAYPHLNLLLTPQHPASLKAPSVVTMPLMLAGTFVMALTPSRAPRRKSNCEST